MFQDLEYLRHNLLVADVLIYESNCEEISLYEIEKLTLSDQLKLLISRVSILRNSFLYTHNVYTNCRFVVAHKSLNHIIGPVYVMQIYENRYTGVTASVRKLFVILWEVKLKRYNRLGMLDRHLVADFTLSLLLSYCNCHNINLKYELVQSFFNFLKKQDVGTASAERKKNVIIL